MSEKQITLSIKVKPKSKKEYVKRIDEDHLEVAVNAPPEDGKANKRVIELLGEYFNTPKKNILLIRGEKSRHKMFSITLNT